MPTQHLLSIIVIVISIELRDADIARHHRPHEVHIHPRDVTLVVKTIKLSVENGLRVSYCLICNCLLYDRTSYI